MRQTASRKNRLKTRRSVHTHPLWSIWKWTWSDTFLQRYTQTRRELRNVSSNVVLLLGLWRTTSLTYGNQALSGNYFQNKITHWQKRFVCKRYKNWTLLLTVNYVCLNYFIRILNCLFQRCILKLLFLLTMDREAFWYCFVCWPPTTWGRTGGHCFVYVLIVPFTLKTRKRKHSIFVLNPKR